MKYRRPFGTEWEDLDLDTAMDMIADRVLEARRKGWQDADTHGNKLRRTTGIASLGAVLDNEENYLINDCCNGGTRRWSRPGISGPSCGSSITSGGG